MTKHEQDNAYVVECTLRNFPPLPPFCVEWKYPLLVRADLDPTKLKQANGRPKKHSEDDILKLLPPTGLLAGEWEQMAGTECDIAHATFHRLRKSLERNNRVLKSKVNEKWTPIILSK
jgi:hypothetical protein